MTKLSSKEKIEENKKKKKIAYINIANKAVTTIKIKLESLYKEFLNYMSGEIGNNNSSANKIYVFFENELNNGIKKLQELLDFLEEIEIRYE